MNNYILAIYNRLGNIFLQNDLTSTKRFVYRVSTNFFVEGKTMAQNKPTEAELDILSVLWQHEFATVREVYEILNQTKPTGYTTVLKMLQIMDEKGLVERDTQLKAHIYRAKLEQKEAQRNFVSNLLD